MTTARKCKYCRDRYVDLLYYCGPCRRLLVMFLNLPWPVREELLRPLPLATASPRTREVRQ